MQKTRQEERREETIREIKTLALRQIEQEGVDHLSLREISREMRVSSAAIYRYFNSREVLLTALIRDAFDGINQAMLSGRDTVSADHPVERMLSTCRAYRDWRAYTRRSIASSTVHPFGDTRPIGRICSIPRARDWRSSWT
jgi:AcrR family transcriptional regulator